MSEIEYRSGDATAPAGDGCRIIAHCCNDIGGWGAGFVLAISKKWKEPEQKFRLWYQEREKSGFGLGKIQLVQVEEMLWVANMIGQHGIKGRAKVPPIRYEALEECLEQLGTKAQELDAAVHMPRIGCGLAGGKWELVEPLLIKHLCAQGIKVIVYDF